MPQPVKSVEQPWRLLKPAILGPKRNNNAAAPHFLAALRPPIHHVHALVPKVGAGVGAAQGVVSRAASWRPMASAFQRPHSFKIEMPTRESHGRSCRLGEAQTAQSGVDRVFAHAARAERIAGKGTPAAGYRMKLAQDRDGARRQRDAMRTPHLHLAAGIDQMPASRSNSAHSAERSSPGRTKVRASNSSAARVSGAPLPGHRAKRSREGASTRSSQPR